jgi:hypothetical protein
VKDISEADKIKTLKFQHLFNALELVTNMDGDNRKRDNFDKKASILSKLNPTISECGGFFIIYSNMHCEN